MDNAIFLCGRTALGVWQLLRCLWKPRLDQLQPLPHSLRQLNGAFRPTQAWPPSEGSAATARTCTETADQRRTRVCDRLTRLCRALQTESRRGGPFSDVSPAWDIDEGSAIRRVVERAPLELMVSSPGLRGQSVSERFHVRSGDLPADMFVDLGEGINVMAPVYVVLQLSSMLDEDELRMLAFELRGAYATERFAAAPSDRCLPLFDAADVERALTLLPPNFYGARRGGQPLRKTIDGAASVMEAASVLLLCTERRRGGYGFPAPAMNWRIDVPSSLRTLSRWPWVAIDAFWPGQQVAFEYNGAVAHQGAERMERDVLRDNVLSVLGLPTVAITARQFFDAGQFDQAARQLAQLLGIHMSARDYGRAWLRAREALRARVMGVLSADTPCVLWG